MRQAHLTIDITKNCRWRTKEIVVVRKLALPSSLVFSLDTQDGIHLFTNTNPVRQRRHYEPSLAIENFGLAQADLTQKFNSATEIGMPGAATLQDIVKRLENIYCESIGVEYMHINNTDEKQYIRKWLQNNENHPQ